MRPPRVYDIKSVETDYHNLLSRKKDCFFWNAAKMKDIVPGEIVFFVNRKEREALYAVATDAVLVVTCNRKTLLQEFEYGGSTYVVNKGESFRKYQVSQIVPIPSDWKWQKPLRTNEMSYLWVDGEDNLDRAARAGDLRRLFQEGPAFHLLGQYSLRIAANKEPIIDKNPKRTDMDPIQTENALKPAKNELNEAKGIFDFGHPYRNILMAARTKPFVLLSGLSGVGKSWTARQLAYITCSDPALRNAVQPGNFAMVRVKPNWHEPEDLLGYKTMRQDFFRYNCTDLLRFIVKAWKHPQVPFWVCLDEMNLAPPESYLSDFLIILESARQLDGTTIYDAFISSDDVAAYSNEDPSFWKQLGIAADKDLQQLFLQRGIAMPANLVLLGTINMDETTHSLSGRLLDRAMVIEMQTRDMQVHPYVPASGWTYPETFEAAALLTQCSANSELMFSGGKEISGHITRYLENIKTALKDTRFILSNRAWNDTVRYCFQHQLLEAATSLPANWLNDCIDECICMKVLVRIGGDADTCERVIERLLQATRYFPRSQQKLLQMQALLKNTGYTSFW